MIVITVCICTHAPDRNLLARVITALAAQTLEPDKWEVLLVENAEDHSCDRSILSPLACRSTLMLEKRPGKVEAMATAVAAAAGDWIVFVDDDNLVAPDYLESLLKLSAAFPQIGVFSASISGAFESPVPEWATPFLIYLAVRTLDRPRWANCQPAPVGPVGAGMCARIEIARTFAELVRSGDLCPGLGRTRGSLTAGTDDTVFMDLAFQAGLGCGTFPELKLQHVIHPRRLELAYLKRLVRDITFSHTVLASRRGPVRINPLRSTAKLLVDQLLLCGETCRETRAIKRARAKGAWAGKIHIWRQSRSRARHGR